VLVAHHALHGGATVWVAHVLGVVDAQRLDDAPAVGEQMRDDVRPQQARVLRLNVEAHAVIADVVVVSDTNGDPRHRAFSTAPGHHETSGRPGRTIVRRESPTPST
jgi:hypothetical protein